MAAMSIKLPQSYGWIYIVILNFVSRRKINELSGLKDTGSLIMSVYVLWDSD